MLGAGYEWKGIAFYGYEPPGLPPNSPPEVLIFEGKNFNILKNLIINILHLLESKELS